MSDHEKRIVEFERLNPLGKVVFLGGALSRILANSVEYVIERAVDVVVETEKAFREGRDPSIEDAKILEEYELPPHSEAPEKGTA